MASNEVWGIDIGKSGIKAVKMRRLKDQVEILGIDIIEYEESSESEVDKEEQVRQALIEFQARNKIKNEQIYVSIPGQATFNRMITIPPVEPKRVKEIVTYEAQQQIPFPIDEVLWDYQVIIGDDKSVEEREIMLFAVRREIINNFLTNLSAAQLNVSGIQIAPLAIYNFLRYERPELGACVGVDIGAENTDLVVVDDEKLWLRALPSAGSDITKALQKRFNIPYAEAEKLKLKSGRTKQSKKIFEVMKPILKDIVGEIHRSVGFYKSTAKEVRFDKMIFLGNVTKLSGFQSFFSQNLQYDIEILSKLEKIRVSPKINVNLFQTNITTFAVAMGLCIQGLKLAKNNIKLLPPEIWLKDKLQTQKPYLAAAVAILAVIPIWFWINNDALLQRIQKTTKEVRRALKPIERKVKELKKAKKYGNITKELAYISRFGVNRDISIFVLNSINKTYLNASKTIANKSQNKIWILNLSIEEKKDSGKQSLLKTGLKYVETVFSVAFKSLNDPVQNRDYIIKYLQDPLKEYKYKNRALYDNDMSSIKIDIKDTLFPTDDAAVGEEYCHIELHLWAWVDHEYLFEFDDEKYIKSLYQKDTDRILELFKKNKHPLSGIKLITPKTNNKVKPTYWTIIDKAKNQEYFLKISNNKIKVFKKE